MIDWNAKRAKIAAKLAEVGSASTLKRTTKVYNKRTDKTVTTTVEIPCFAVLSLETSNDQEGQLVTYQMATITEEPSVNDTIVIGTDTFQITKAMAIAPGGIPILFSVVLQT